MPAQEPAQELPAGWRTLADGAGFVEGPVAQGDAVAFVSVNRGLVYRAALDGSALDGSGASVLAEPGSGPNGMAAGPDGSLWLVQNGGRVMESRSDRAAGPGIQVIDAGEAVRAELARDDLSAPNDCAFGPDGRLWFTDPYGRLMPDPEGDPDRTGAHGRVWAYDPRDGGLELIADALPHPNGLCFTADDARLLVTDTRTCSVVAFETAGSGRRPGREIATLPAGKPDGMAFDADGYLWIAATDAEGVAVLAPDGTWELVALGRSFPTNVCFAGAGLATLVVTAARGGRVLAGPARAPGLALHTGD